MEGVHVSFPASLAIASVELPAPEASFAACALPHRPWGFSLEPGQKHAELGSALQFFASGDKHVCSKCRCVHATIVAASFRTCFVACSQIMSIPVQVTLLA